MSRTLLTALLAALVSLLGPALVAAPAGAAVPTCDGLPATIVGTDGNDTITGTDGPDVIVALAGSDVVDGAAGDDVVCGNEDDDELGGGEGADRVFGGADRIVEGVKRGDAVRGGPGDDYLDPGYDPRYAYILLGAHDRVDFFGAEAGVDVDLLAGTARGPDSGSDRLAPATRGVQGSWHDDVIRGTDRTDYLGGGNGADIVDGRGGEDRLTTDGGDGDVVRGGPGNDDLDAADGGGRLLGDEGADHLRGPNGYKDYGHTILEGGAGTDLLQLYLTDLDRTVALDGGPDRDELAVHLGRAALPVGSAARLDTVQGTLVAAGHQRATLRGLATFGLSAPLTWTFAGGPVNERVWGWSRFSLTANGQGGDDAITGSAGDDRLYGGPGTDTIDGRNGRDLCRAERKVGCES